MFGLETDRRIYLLEFLLARRGLIPESRQAIIHQSTGLNLRRFQTRKRLAACFLDMILVSRTVRQALALDTLESKSRPFPVGYAEASAV